MRRMAMVLALVALAVSRAGAEQQQEEQQAERRRALEQQMRQLDQQMRALERQLRDLERQLERLGPEARRAEIRVRTPLVQLFTQRAYLGVTVATEKDPATDSIGARLVAVSPGGPADKAGLKAGDIVTTFNGEKLAGRYPAAGDYQSEPGRKLVDLARELEEGDTVVVDYRRGQETHRATLVARRLEPGAWGFVVTSPPVPPIPPIQPGRLVDSIMGAIGLGWPERWLDLELVTLDTELGEYFGTSEGLLVVRAPKDSTLKLQSGDVILSVDGRRPSSQSQLMRILRSYAPGEAFKLEIVRHKRRLTLVVTVPERRVRRGGVDPLELDLEWRPLESLPG